MAAPNATALTESDKWGHPSDYKFPGKNCQRGGHHAYFQQKNAPDEPVLFAKTTG